MRTTAWAIGVLLMGGCFTDPGGTGGPVSTSMSSSGSDGSGSGDDSGSSTTTVVSTDSSSGVPTSSDATTASSSGSSSTTGPGEGDPCDPWAPVCAEGLKCAAYASDGGNSWDANRCTEVTGDDKAGGGCVVEESGTSGIDSCEVGAMCWDVDPLKLTGTCYALCSGTPSNPICPPGSTCFETNGSTVNVCVIDCDPLGSDCPSGHVCVPDAEEQFLCLPPASVLQRGAACDYINDCAPGLMCGDPAIAASDCDDQASRCCLEYCNLSGGSCPGILECMAYPFADGTAPAALENLGLCADPP